MTTSQHTAVRARIFVHTGLGLERYTFGHTPDKAKAAVRASMAEVGKKQAPCRRGQGCSIQGLTLWRIARASFAAERVRHLHCRQRPAARTTRLFVLA
jgi:hypothetical protein